MSFSSDFDVLIVGAGPAGLTAGFELVKLGKKNVCLLETDPTYVGGISRTEKYKGFSFDIGGHRFFSKSEEIVALWKEVLPDDLIERSRLSRIYYQNKFYAYPLHAFEALFNLGLWESFLCMLSYAKAKLFPNSAPHSFADWVTNQFGERLFKTFFKTYTEKVWGMSCDDLSADWAAQRIKGLNLLTAILAGLPLPFKRRKKIIKTLIEAFLYPRLGPGMMWEAVSKKIKDAGGQLIMGQKANRFVWQEDKKVWLVTAVDRAGKEYSYRAAHVISSAPLREVVPAVEPRMEKAALAERLYYRDFITVTLMLRKEPSFKDNWIYIHDPSVAVGRIQNFSAWSPELVPEKGLGCLGMEYFCFEGDDVWNAADDALIARATEELIKLNLVDVSDVMDGHVVRQAKAYPVYDDHYAAIVATIRDELAVKYPTFHCIGRNGMHKYNNQDHAMMTGLLTARNIAQGSKLYNVWAVNEDAAYHEEECEAT